MFRLIYTSDLVTSADFLNEFRVKRTHALTQIKATHFIKQVAFSHQALAAYEAESSLRIISAPALNAFSLPRATSRAKGAMPQLVEG